jgi:hypothetical protein
VFASVRKMNNEENIPEVLEINERNNSKYTLNKFQV